MANWETVFEYKDGHLYWLSSRGNAKAGSKAGSITKDGYWYLQYDKRQIYAHRVVWEMHNGEIPDGLCVDHINTNKSDNRLCNLRLVTVKENGYNRNAKGYCLDKVTNKWKAYIKRDGVVYHLGYFEKESDAALAYAEAKKQYHVIKTEVA